MISSHSELAKRVQAARSRIDQELGQAQAVAKQGKRAQDRVAELEELAEIETKVNLVLTSIGEFEQAYAQQQIEELVTRGLQVIFDETLSFHLVQNVKANQAVVDFVVRSSYGDSTVDTPLMDARGGGLVAVVGFLLRLVLLLLTPQLRRMLVMDEPFAHVSAEYEPRLAEFLREVVDKAGVQIFMVTHSQAYDDLADKRYGLHLGSDGKTLIKEL